MQAYAYFHHQVCLFNLVLVSQLFNFSTSQLLNLPLLSLRQAIGFFISPHIQQFEGTDLEIAAHTHIEPDHILLVQRVVINALKTDIVLVHQIGIHRAGWPYLGTSVTDADEIELNARMSFAFFCDGIRLFIAFNKKIHTGNGFISCFF